MSSKVTCAFTKEKIDKELAVSYIPEGKTKNIYFKSNLIFKLWKEEQEADYMIQKKINEALNVYALAKLPIQFNKKYKQWLESYNKLEILYTINIVENEINQHKSKGINYMIAIIDNNLFRGKELLDSKMKFKDSEKKEEIFLDLYEEPKFLGNRINVVKFL